MSPVCSGSSTAPAMFMVSEVIAIPPCSREGTQHSSALRSKAQQHQLAGRVATACRWETRSAGSRAVDGPVYWVPCLASLRSWHTRVPDIAREGTPPRRRHAPLLVRALARHDVARGVQPLRVTP